jgi:hypothetical protein
MGWDNHVVYGTLVAGALAAYGCVGNIGDGGETGVGSDARALTSGARRLSRAEYQATLTDLLGQSVDPNLVAEHLESDPNAPFDNDYESQIATGALVGAIENVATKVIAAAIADPGVRAAIVPCEPTGPEDAVCFEAFVRSFGRRALRRPLSDEEVTRYVQGGDGTPRMLDYAVERNDFYAAVEHMARVFLQHPEFLYRIEIGTPVAGYTDVFHLNGFEVATRLSYTLWGTTPDDELLDAAESGALDTREGIRAAASRLLAAERAHKQVERFHALWLGFHRLPHPPELTNAMRIESAALIERVVFTEPQDYLGLYTAQETFVNDTLAEHYGLAKPLDPGGSWVSYQGTGRMGLLSHGSVLSASTAPAVDDTSFVRRGIYIRELLMCEEIPPPPPNVNVDMKPQETAEAHCKQEIHEQLHLKGGCANCHVQIDPIGFGLENYDLAGRYRTHDIDKPECTITGEGKLEGVGTFKGPAGLAEQLIASGKLERCAVKRMYQYAVGREPGSRDLAQLAELYQAFTANGRRFDQLLLDLVSSEGFRHRRTEKEETP